MRRALDSFRPQSRAARDGIRRHHTDRDFERNARNANGSWLDQVARGEPDLELDGMRDSILTRLLGPFGGKVAK